MKRLMYIYILIFLLFIPGFATAANHYVREGSTGNGDGSNWTNAFTSLPSTLIRGDTYYIADGAYGAYTFNDAESGSTYIYIKKATGDDHGTETGWQSSYGDGVATWTGTGRGWTMDTGYYDFDGQVGSGQSGHGFKLATTACSSQVHLIHFNSGVDHCNFSHIELLMCGNVNIEHDAVYAVSGGNDIKFDYCYFKNISRTAFLLRNRDSVLIDHCYAENIYNSYGIHQQFLSDGGSDYVTIRYSIFKNIKGTSIISPTDSNHWKIYGNVFFATDSKYSTSNGVLSERNEGTTITDIRFYNNTIYNLYTKSGTQVADSNTSDLYSYNNLWYNCTNTNSVNCLNFTKDYNTYIYSNRSWDCGLTTHENDYLSGSDPFADSANGDFHLSAATDAGDDTIGSEYNADSDGVTRGADGNWDRGAFEYNSTDSSGPPAIPTGVTGN